MTDNTSGAQLRSQIISVPPEERSNGGAQRVFAGLSLCVSLGFILMGLNRMYTYDSGEGSSDKIVGGDAYNYTIHALHGVGLICVGVAFAVIACTFAVLGSRRR